MLAYNITIEKTASGFKATCGDFPQLSGVGKDSSAAAQDLKDNIFKQLRLNISAKQEIPFPPVVLKRQKMIAFSILIAAKICLSNSMIRKNMSKMALARQMKFHLPQVSRLLDLTHTTKIETLEEALSKLGKRLTVGITAIRD